VTPTTPLDRLAIWAGIVGSMVVGLGAVVTGLGYVGKAGESYSPLNHFVSELGELAESDLAAVFNAALVVGGVCFALFMLGLGVAHAGWLPNLYGVLGVLAGIGGAFVGIFPMDFRAPHGIAALTFFGFGTIAVGLASIDFVRRPDPRSPAPLAIVGGAAVVSFVGFFALLAGETGGLARPDLRPAVWPVAIFEWLLLACIVLWVFLTALCWQRATAAR